MAGENYVLVYVDPALDDGYLIWPLSTEGATVVGFSEVTGECLYCRANWTSSVFAGIESLSESA
jgi:hypothetical protein